mmetsp:Transcript_8683/g.17609  ORF Transcript_8683/g.17609 Transcript_8683/m.17609 type:complete len:298 (+) Transcript_8683:1721-2614(+)
MLRMEPFRRASAAVSVKSKTRILREAPVDAELLREIESHRLGRRRAPRQSWKRRLYAKNLQPPQLRLEGRERAAFSRGAVLTGHWDLTNGDRLTTLWPNHFVNVPEVALIGRSNVGKSSFINAFLGVGKRLSKVEDRPGTTLKVTRYVLRSGALGFLDMPGYGFAYAGDKHWEAAFELLRRRVEQEVLKRVLILLDARHGLKHADWEIIQKIEEIPKLQYQVILNKSDLVLPVDLAKQVFVTRDAIRQHGLRAYGRVLMISAYQQRGIQVVYNELLPIAGNFEARTRMGLKHDMRPT